MIPIIRRIYSKARVCWLVWGCWLAWRCWVTWMCCARRDMEDLSRIDEIRVIPDLSFVCLVDGWPICPIAVGAYRNCPEAIPSLYRIVAARCNSCLLRHLILSLFVLEINMWVEPSRRCAKLLYLSITDILFIC